MCLCLPCGNSLPLRGFEHEERHIPLGVSESAGEIGLARIPSGASSAAVRKETLGQSGRLHVVM